MYLINYLLQRWLGNITYGYMFSMKKGKSSFFPHFPFHYWGDEVLKIIGDALGKYIDREEPRSILYSYARICIEVDLEKGL
jgi:hypothetical protein